jgi:hypothetical protein
MCQDPDLGIKAEHEHQDPDLEMKLTVPVYGEYLVLSVRIRILVTRSIIFNVMIQISVKRLIFCTSCCIPGFG